MVTVSSGFENNLAEAPIDLAVGIPSYNEADRIEFVVRQAARGLRRFFPGLRSAIVNADNCSEDGTREVFLDAETRGIPKVYLSTPEGVRGKGNNFLNLFRFLSSHRPSAVVVVDADLRSITPEWIHELASPVLQGADFASPLYSRNEYDGTITNHVCYPLIYGILGCDLRQPIGGDFAFSKRLMEFWLSQPWSPQIRHYGVDIFMTLGALQNGFRLAQVALGAKVHKPSAPKLNEMFTQVVDTLFSRLLACRPFWKLNGAPVETPQTFGQTAWVEPPPLSVDYKELKKRAIEAFEARRSELAQILPEASLARIESMIISGRLRLSASLWSKIVFTFLNAYREAAGNDRVEVVETLKPLYMARVVSFIKETIELDHRASEGRILSQARAFRRQRTMLSAGSCRQG